ncbi:MAG: hypothetical protein KatS3mg038_2768 [Candidatus Kapaibacterium sp.]|nr:MAG: hypothetical protein KatS3mg038_2768 [Candidatus Kapabacteria bacterium]
MWVTQRRGDPTVRSCVKALVRHALAEIAKIDFTDDERREHIKWLTAIALVVGAAKPTRKAVKILGPQICYRYARDVICGRWPEAEPVIATDPRCAYLYAFDVIRGRWPEAEPVIAQDAWCASAMQLDVIRGRWPEAEPVIAQDAECDYLYAANVICGWQ